MTREMLLAGCLLALSASGAMAQSSDLPAGKVASPSQPALLPAPRELVWGRGRLPMAELRWISAADSSLLSMAGLLQAEAGALGHRLPVRVGRAPAGRGIRLAYGPVGAPDHPEEAYRLQVTEKGVLLTAVRLPGMYNAVQTLRQLMDDGGGLRFADVRDWPAFGWRGFMIDVGRNYMSVARLKRIIDVMAAYKMNVFHFHPTEDIAWRLQVRRHPELTDPSTMTRWKGLSYTEAEVRGLIAYCRERQIRFVLEIDMPGHSAAFRRATGHDMQSDSGMAILKDVMSEVMDAYDTEYIHIGADEVRIVNRDFVPEMTRFIRARGRQVLGWQPGGNFDDATIRQLWRETPGRNSIDFKGPYLDSRHLYLNHHDPLESVVTVFHRQLAGKSKSDSLALGAILCLWNDRAVADEADLLRMNPVYPSLLAFAERSWRGGGRPGWIANIPEHDSLGFHDFEQRLLRQRDLHFRDQPFPYVRQTALRWNLYGPFERVTDSLTPVFDPTRPPDGGMAPFRTLEGGTVILRHWWAPLVEGAVSAPADHTTMYAYTKFWSDVDRTGRFWIGFNDPSRSYATNPPEADTWDPRGSAIWLNGTPVPPPAWARAGQKGHPEIPLVDEAYSYRPPMALAVRKGWNHVWLRLPARTFRVRDGGNPEKWMFTFVEVE